MDEDKKKLIMIITAVVCVALAITIMIINMGGGAGGGPSKSGKVHMLCDSCEATYTITSEEFSEQMRQTMAGRGMRMRGPMVLTCKECGEYAAYRATKCPKCDEIFVPGDAEDEQYPDRCPACNHSPMEQRIQNK